MNFLVNRVSETSPWDVLIMDIATNAPTDFPNGSFPWTPIVTQDRAWAYAVNVGICIVMFVVPLFMALQQTHSKKVLVSTLGRFAYLKGENWKIPEAYLFSSHHSACSTKHLFIFRYALLLLEFFVYTSLIALVYGVSIQLSYIIWEVEWMVWCYDSNSTSYLEYVRVWNVDPMELRIFYLLLLCMFRSDWFRSHE